MSDSGGRPGREPASKRVFSSFEFLRTFYEVYGCIRAVFSTSLSRAVPGQSARLLLCDCSRALIRAQEYISLVFPKEQKCTPLVRFGEKCTPSGFFLLFSFCLGYQILNFHSRVRTRFRGEL